MERNGFGYFGQDQSMVTPFFCNTVHQMEWMACFNLSGVYWARIPRHDEHSHLAILTK
jgi:hypothetical protein